MPKLFISYSRHDQAFAQRLAAALARMGADIWMDVEDIPAGMKWSSAIQEGLDTGDLMIVILSPESMASRNVEDEWQYYLDNGKPIIPVLLRPAKVHFQLSRIQYIDFSRGDFDAALVRLHGELLRKGIALQPPPTLTSTSTPPSAPPPAFHPTPYPPVQRAAPPGSPARRTPPTGVPRLPLIAGGAVGLVLLLIIGVGIGVLLTTNSRSEDPATPTQITVQLPLGTEASAGSAPALGMAGSPVSRNQDWTPLLRVIDGVTMTLVPAGTFVMGANDESTANGIRLCTLSLRNESFCPELITDESPTASVTFAAPFWIDVTEVTNRAYGSSGTYGGDDYPRTNVTWQEAQSHCERRDARLPTEAEWEYAARGPDALQFPWGNDWDGVTSLANVCDTNCIYDWKEYAYNDGNAHTETVGAYPEGQSWVGAMNMAGNVWEWTSSLYWAYPYDPDDGREDPTDTTTPRTVRGSSWNWIAAEMRTSARAEHADGYPSSDWYGFRCARDFVEGDLERWSAP